jgi:DNA-directed RNA polymerase specialized sigma24 family protein
MKHCFITSHGCEDCFVLLYSRFHRSLFSLSRKILRDKIEAEDITQEVLTILVARPKTLTRDVDR